MTTYNTYKMSKVIEEKMKTDLVELGHSPSSSYFDIDREEIDDFIKLFHALPYTEYTQLLDEWKFYTVFTECFLLNYSKPEYDNKIHRLLTETIWKEIAVSPPNITKDKKLNDTYSATWEVRIPLGYKHEAKNIYKSCCKYIEVKK